MLTADSDEVTFAQRRRRFLQAQGFAYDIRCGCPAHVPGDCRGPYVTEAEQAALLARIFAAAKLTAADGEKEGEDLSNDVGVAAVDGRLLEQAVEKKPRARKPQRAARPVDSDDDFSDSDSEGGAVIETVPIAQATGGRVGVYAERGM